MSSSFSSRQDPPSRTWWSLSSKVPHAANGIPYSDSAKSSRQSLSKSSGLNFNSIASAMGFKSKKHPTLAIQSPPAPVHTPSSPAVGSAKYHNRPPSKSVSSVVSHAGSLESQSPVGGRKNTRQSLLTLSDTDPFRRGGTSAHPTHVDRLSVHSNSSITELGPKLRGRSMLNRISSSSSSAIHHGSELSPSSVTQSPTTTPELPTQNLSPKRSVGSLHRKRSIRPPDGSLISAWDSLTQPQPATISKSTSLSTLTDKNRHSQPEPNLHSPPPMRPRGMTDSKANQLSSSHQQKLSHARNSPSTNSPTPGPSTTSPRVVVRQASMSRIGSPPSAPPMHELPPPPRMNDARESDPYITPDASAASGSSSSLSFASPSNKEPVLIQPHNTLSKKKRSSEHISALSSRTEIEHSGNRNSKASHCSLTPGPIKKALSHQSLTKRGSSSSSPDRTSATPPPERTVEKLPRKQRSFHQQKSSKFSIPPAPARHTNSSGSQSPISVNDSVPLTDQRRDSAGAISPGRKRLFSGSNLRRPSVAQHLPSEDDTLSVFSMRSEQEFVPSFFKPVSPTASSSFWDEGTHDHVPDSPRGVGHEYTPQQIMSPAEMAKVEASVEESSVHSRARGLSVLSVSSATSDGSESVASGSLTLSTWHSGAPISTPQRTASLFLTGLTVPRRLAVRPSTSDAHVTEPSTQSTSPKPSSSPPQVMTSLPPPPRPRTRPPIVTQVASEDEPGLRTPSPLIRRSLLSKALVEKSFNRQSVMKKPSFLEIDDDDTDKESEGEIPGEPLHGSFLDLARESFDTVRSVDD